INTHYHEDHTHGNPGFPPGTRVISTTRTLDHLRKIDEDYWTEGAEELLPNETFRDVKVIRLGDKTISMIHPGRGHTDGDLIVHFAEDKTIHAGDLYFNRYYPNIDLEAGGSVQRWSATIDQVLKLPFEYVIPGHGELSDAAGMRRFQTLIDQLVEVGNTAVGTSAGVTETIDVAKLTADEDYREIYVPFVVRIDRAFVLRRTWEEFTGN
ncbi:MAG: MBL fold metallo-hydrolase, partial [Halioglobus sp.]|nr:MBL fold metallo-hydrolase [Halioglobus sp.]